MLLFVRDGVQPAYCDKAKEMIKVSYIKRSKILHVIETVGHTGHMLQKEKLKSLRMGPVISCCGPEQQSNYGTLA